MAACLPNRNILIRTTLLQLDQGPLDELHISLSFIHTTDSSYLKETLVRGTSVTKNQGTSLWAVTRISETQMTFPKAMHCVLQKMLTSSLLPIQSLAVCQTKPSGSHDSPQPRKSLEMVRLSISFVCHKVGVFCVGTENNYPKPLFPR